MSPLDWFLVALVLLATLGIAALFARRGSRDTAEFFAGGREMPWWLAGTSMVATTFAADTPLAVTELVAGQGVSGNWVWWNMALGGMLTVFFFARLWRRSGVMTDVALVESRYSGAPAAWLRGIKAVVFGLLANAVVIGWVVLAMATVVRVLFPGLTVFGREAFSILGAPVDAPTLVVGGLVLIVALYSMLAGLWGIAATDAVQFTLAMAGSVALAVYAIGLPEIGGLAGLRAQVAPEALRILPTLGSPDASGVAQSAASFVIGGWAFVAFFAVQWWASWYPGSEPGGGGYVAQRMLATRSERDSVLATLWFTIAHYCLRPWPWIIAALAALVLYPGLDAPREGYVLLMRDALPNGVLGLMVAAFGAAFMSTISTQLNWGTSYLVHDLYRRFAAPEASERHLVFAGRLVTLGLAVVGILVATRLESVSGAWELLLAASAGMGLVLILRWYWWRVNAWSELTATLVPLALLALSALGVPIPFLDSPFPESLFGIVAIATAAWLLATFLTRPTPEATLDAFYRQVRPGGPGWKPVAARNADVRPDSGLGPRGGPVGARRGRRLRGAVRRRLDAPREASGGGRRARLRRRRAGRPRAVARRQRRGGLRR